MNVKFLKRFLWVANVVLVAAILFVAVRLFVLGGAKRLYARDAETILGKASVPKASQPVRASQILPVDTYAKAWQLHISGTPPVIEKPVAPGETPRAVAPLEKDYNLVWTKVDTGDPTLSLAHLEKVADKTKVLNVPVGGLVEGVWKLLRVRNDEADFVQVRSEEKVTLKAKRNARVELGEGKTDAGGKSLGDTIGVDATAKQPREAPTRRMVEVREGSGIYDVFREEQEWWGQYGEEVLEKDVTIQPVTDPDTGRPAGIMLKDISANSYALQCGLLPGDIVRSVNGVPMNSRSDVVQYVKGPGKGLSKYEAEIDRKGRIIRKTYNVRPK